MELCPYPLHLGGEDGHVRPEQLERLQALLHTDSMYSRLCMRLQESGYVPSSGCAHKWVGVGGRDAACPPHSGFSRHAS